MTKVIFFTAGPVPTTEEKAAIEAINASRFELFVRNRLADNTYGGRDETCDYVVGEIPDHEIEQVPTGFAAADVFTSSAIIAANQLVITDQDAITVGASEYTFTIVEGVITDIAVV